MKVHLLVGPKLFFLCFFAAFNLHNAFGMQNNSSCCPEFFLSSLTIAQISLKQPLQCNSTCINGVVLTSLDCSIDKPKDVAWNDIYLFFNKLQNITGRFLISGIKNCNFEFSSVKTIKAPFVNVNSMQASIKFLADLEFIDSSIDTCNIDITLDNYVKGPISEKVSKKFFAAAAKGKQICETNGTSNSKQMNAYDQARRANESSLWQAATALVGTLCICLCGCLCITCCLMKCRPKNENSIFWQISDCFISIVSCDKSRGDEEFEALSRAVSKEQVNAFFANPDQVLVLESSRVILRDWKTDFIDANYVDMPGHPKRVIATQAPSKRTAIDFWRMVMENNVQTIFMFAEPKENGKRIFPKYYPDDYQDLKTFGDMVITGFDYKIRIVHDTKEVVIRRDLQVEGPLGKWDVAHYEWIGWPDKGLPHHGIALADLLNEAGYSSNGEPLLFHCSNGMGRTGVVLMVEYVLCQIRAGWKVDNCPDILKTIRSQRYQAVETKEQYHFARQMLLMYFWEEYKILDALDRKKNKIKKRKSENYERPRHRWIKDESYSDSSNRRPQGSAQLASGRISSK